MDSRAKILFGPGAHPSRIWRGVENVNREGVALAHEMLCALEDTEEDADGICLSSYASLEDWPREGRPFRNIVAEYLAAAREAGPEVEAGFCAALTDFIALGIQGMTCDADRYESLMLQMKGGAA